jgi:hypothetical protein
VDIALLLPVPSAKKAGSLAMGVCRGELGSLLGKEVDLVNLRLMDTVFQNEILHSAREFFAGNRNAADVLSIPLFRNDRSVREFMGVLNFDGVNADLFQPERIQHGKFIGSCVSTGETIVNHLLAKCMPMIERLDRQVDKK